MWGFWLYGRFGLFHPCKEYVHGCVVVAVRGKTAIGIIRIIMNPIR
jgi:hypothetical protein